MTVLSKHLPPHLQPQVIERVLSFSSHGYHWNPTINKETRRQLNTFKNVSANLRVTQATIKRGIISPETIGEGSAFLHNWLTAVKRLDKINLGT